MSKVIEAKINLLLDLKYPDYRRFREDNYYSNADDYDEVIQSGNQYYEEISDLNETELTELFTKEKAKHDEEIRKLKELEESQHFYNAPNAEADFEHYAKLQFWLPEEFVALSLGKSPKVVTEKALNSLNDTAFGDSYHKRRVLVQRAQKSAKLNPENTPSEYLIWSQQNNLALPVELVNEVTKHGQVIDWKKKHDKLEVLYKKQQADAALITKERDHSNALHTPPHVEAETSDAKQFSPRERNTLLRLIIGMAIDSYGYDPLAGRSPVPAQLASDLETRGIQISDDTIRKILQNAKEIVPQEVLNDMNK